MPPFGTLGPETAVTPYRQTGVELDGPQWVLSHAAWHLERRADEIERVRSAVTAIGATDGNMFRIPGLAWILFPKLLDLTNTIRTGDQGDILDKYGFNVATGSAQVITFFAHRTPADLPGVTVDGSVVQQGVPVFTKMVQPGGSFFLELQADRLAFPAPPAIAQQVPLDRLLSGTLTWPENQPLVFSFYVPPQPAIPPDGMFNFYWGGPSDTDPDDVQTEGWCLTFRGDGTAQLWERVNQDWLLRDRIRWSNQGRPVAGWAYITIIPYRNNHFCFATSVSGTAASVAGAGASAFVPSAAETTLILYKQLAAVAGYRYDRHISGAGSLRMDARQDQRFLVSLGVSKFALEGVLVDEPFVIPFVVPAGTRISIVAYPQDQPIGCTLESQLFDADTGAELTRDADNYYLTNSEQQKYQARFTFHSNLISTPFLESYAVDLFGSVSLTADSAQTGGRILAVSVDGPDADATHETGTLTIDDPTGVLTSLATRGRVPLKLITTIDQAGNSSVLFQGEVSDAPQEQVYLSDGRIYDRYEAALCGEWAKLWDQKILFRRSFGIDPTASSAVPWKVRDIIEGLFLDAGVPPEQLDLPAHDLRLWPSGDGSQSYILQPGLRYLQVIEQLARTYLDWFIVFDPNAGLRGMWRGIENPPDPANNVLYNFVLGPTSGRKLVHVPGAYPDRTTFVTKLITKRQAPEANSIYVVGVSERLANGRPGYITAHAWNPDSFDRDPANPTATNPLHPDRLPREVREIFYDPAINCQDHANYLCRRIYDLIAHGRTWKQFYAPLALMTDPDDEYQVRPRPLRIGDPITVDEVPCVLRSCNFSYTSDRAQMAYYEAVQV